MKNTTILIAVMLLAMIMPACEENEVLPDYSKKGTVIPTVASITASNPEPAAGETITLTLMYVNLSSDPVKNIVLKAKVGTGDYGVVETWEEGSAPVDEAVTHQISYVAPAAGTEVTFEMVITSQQKYLQIKRTSITAK